MTPLVATYRLQLGPDLTFADAAALVPYLRDLGVSHLYLSPVLQARRGSTHGYDVVDPRRVSDALGGESGLRDLAVAGLDLLVDIVPNHMAVSDENPFWTDPELRAKYFDLDSEGGHRRFFDIDELAGVRVEDPDVFAVTHGKIVELVSEGVIAGVRVDHVDGLADPAGYLQRLRQAGVEHVWVEKIVEPGEILPTWPVDGTTGYEFLVDVDALFVDPDGRDALDAAVGDRRAFREIGAEAKAEQVRTTFQPEVRRLRQLADVDGLEAGLGALPVYRTYLDPDSRAASEQDASALTALPPAVAAAMRNPDAAPPEFVVRFQQTTGAVMAKGIEDTAMYRDMRLLSLNEVGGDPDRFGISVEAFHRTNQRRLESWPNALLAATTHDTKRSADVRARIAVLSTMGDRWLDVVEWWRTRCAEQATDADAPDADEQLFALQTLVGTWPLSRARLDRYLVKAFREAKRHTAWVDPDEVWERAVLEVFARAMADPGFDEAFVPFVVDVIHRADRISLGALVLRITAPGVPDVYQGDELWNHLLVDPDNRRPVDWSLRRLLLDHQLRCGAVDRFTAKLFTMRVLFDLRARLAGFTELAYQPLDAPRDVCAFGRGSGEAPDLVVAVPLRPGAEVALPAAVADLPWVDVLEPLDAIYGAHRPGVFARADEVG
ncbi:MAG TPA: alpha-amylase family glycosyl hydrolase [Acidimicrobiia bacterium]|jgi:(1->4)-alpha-D-glucan 1-alpha-D-glucosylmutase